MSHGMLSLRGLMRKVRQRWAAVAVTAALGLAAGTGYAALTPPLLASEAVVLLATVSPGAAAQAELAHSDTILSAARREVSPAIPLPTVRRRVEVRRLAPRVLSIRAKGKTAAEAESLANAVARCYIAYVATMPGSSTKQAASLLDMAEDATGTPLAHHVAVAGGLGAVIGALIGAAGALVIRRPPSPLPRRG